MAQWGDFETSLEEVVRNLNPRAKQAMMAAISKHKVIKRGTWNGCAFNAAGNVLGELEEMPSAVTLDIHSYDAAAEAFGLPIHAVSRFITIWDKFEGTDKEATEALRKALEKVGLFTEAGEKPPRKRIVRHLVYKSKEEQQLEAEFAMLLASDLVPATDDAEQLLMAAR